jgi:hypothetical protein
MQTCYFQVQRSSSDDYIEQRPYQSWTLSYILPYERGSMTAISSVQQHMSLNEESATCWAATGGDLTLDVDT